MTIPRRIKAVDQWIKSIIQFLKDNSDLLRKEKKRIMVGQ